MSVLKINPAYRRDEGVSEQSRSVIGDIFLTIFGQYAEEALGILQLVSYRRARGRTVVVKLHFDLSRMKFEGCELEFVVSGLPLRVFGTSSVRNLMCIHSLHPALSAYMTRRQVERRRISMVENIHQFGASQNRL